MNTEALTRISLDDVSSDGSFSVLTQKYTEQDGQQFVLSNHREVLVPGQFERAREILSVELYEKVQSMWSDEVVRSWRQMEEAAIYG